MKLVHNDGKVPSIIFPKGKLLDGGTCQFASKKCLGWCLCQTNPNVIEKEVYKYFKDNTARDVAEKILMELIDRNKLFLQWFAWGDCPKKLTHKVAWIIKELHNEKVTQCGFTRNRELWERVVEIDDNSDNLVFAYTVENIKDVREHCEWGLVAYPNYDEGKTYLYYGIGTGELKGGSCSGYWYEHPNELRPYEASCDECAKAMRGCFTKRG
jgi:hypothetical protein